MSPIRVLPTALVNKIAAGEVVERPAAVVKELLENAIDAQATRINVEVASGGKKMIRISDDGTGMSAEDVALAFRSHATSKLASDDDLYNIASLGFRGEALASIGSVSESRLVSRSADADEAAAIEVHGDKIGAPQVAGAPVGTTLEVRNLFFNVPARRKFLKSDTTEMGHITEQFTRIALSYPAVQMSLTHNGRSVYELPAGTMLERIGAFFGSDLAAALQPVKVDEKEVSLHGFIAPPSESRATTKMQYLFINGRYIRDRSLFHAIREGYRGLLEGQRQPVVFLFLIIPPDRVDVNVHPTKVEVHFRDGHLIYGLVLATIREKLLSAAMQPHLKPRPLAGTGAPGDEAPMPLAAGTSTDAGHRERVEESLTAFFKSAKATPQQPLPFSSRTRHPGQHSPSGPVLARPAVAPQSPPVATNAAPVTPVPEKARTEDQPTELPRPGQQHESRAAEAAKGPVVKAFQLHNTYLVAETEDGMIIVDQHALHERILYEQIAARLKKGALESQTLLVPETVEGSEAEFELLQAHGEVLGRLGIKISRMGPRAIGIQAVPTFMQGGDAAEFLRDVLDWAARLDKSPDLETATDDIAHLLACHGSVKAGRRLSAEEIASLLQQANLVERASRCPHGRPTTLRFTKADLEKQFGRR